VQLSGGPLEVPPEGSPAAQVLRYRPLRCRRAGPADRSSLHLSDADLVALGRCAVSLDGMPLRSSWQRPHVVAVAAGPGEAG
jgi:hypothetical protein